MKEEQSDQFSTMRSYDNIRDPNRPQLLDFRTPATRLTITSQDLLGFSNRHLSSPTSLQNTQGVGSSLMDKLKSIEIEIEKETENSDIPPSVKPSANHDTIQAEFSNGSELSFDEIRLSWCAFCHRETTTRVEYRPTAKTFWSSVSIFFMGGVFGCFLLPYMSESFKTSQQVCMRCQRIVSQQK